MLISLWEIRSDFLLLLGSGRGWSESCTEASDNMFIGSTLGRIAVTRARAEAVIAQLDSRLKNSERELRTGAADRDRTAALTDECASLVGIARGWGADYFPNFGAGGGELRRARDLVPQVELAAGAEVTAADSLDGKDVVDFCELAEVGGASGGRAR